MRDFWHKEYSFGVETVFHFILWRWPSPSLRTSASQWFCSWPSWVKSSSPRRPCSWCPQCPADHTCSSQMTREHCSEMIYIRGCTGCIDGWRWHFIYFELKMVYDSIELFHNFMIRVRPYCDWIICSAKSYLRKTNCVSRSTADIHHIVVSFIFSPETIQFNVLTVS